MSLDTIFNNLHREVLGDEGYQEASQWVALCEKKYQLSEQGNTEDKLRTYDREWIWVIEAIGRGINRILLSRMTGEQGESRLAVVNITKLQSHLKEQMEKTVREERGVKNLTAKLSDLTPLRLFFANNSPEQLLKQTQGNTWELYKEYDPKGTRKMHQGQFYTLLPKSWKEAKEDGLSFSKMNATYEDCSQLEEWFKDKDAKAYLTQTQGSTWELYKEYDPKGTRKMHQGQFYTLLPKSWKEAKEDGLSF
ncbi:MAG: hypothetical protein Q8O95_00370, partial [bacterium]|nr:hypothetical protein [bacterium]